MPETRSGLHKSAAQWKEHFLLHTDEARAQVGLRPLEVVQVCQAVEDLEAFLLHPDHARIFVLLAEYGIDAAFLACAKEMASELRRANKDAPLHLRAVSTLTPEEQDTVRQAGQLFTRLRNAATRAARTLVALDKVEGLGRGQRFDLDSPAGAQAALRTFRTGAASRQSILDEAGIGERHFQRMDELDTALETILSNQNRRTREGHDRADTVERLSLALGRLFLTFGARAETALAEDTTGTLERVLALIPRREERRHAAPERPEEKDLSARILKDVVWYQNPVVGEAPAGALRAGVRVQRQAEENGFVSVWTEEGVVGWVGAEGVG